jgi:HPt (histidine-containing phosphotransfer) domain-containing protein
MKEYIRMFLKTLPAFHEKIAVALREKDIAQIAAAIHNIKPRLMMMGMKKALELAETIAQLCIEENELVFEHINRLTEQTERSVTELEPVS